MVRDVFETLRERRREDDVIVFDNPDGVRFLLSNAVLKVERSGCGLSAQIIADVTMLQPDRPSPKPIPKVLPW